ncbi:aldehyde dehydrogenase family protein [Propionimicrobium sp. PCR01-08-3]|uniref:aldehyde dehydrogenase family protein n=1 Tax=Propionimicrobium sp. PCR01-08-3 TaxID=3052086 RepID=UPI00255C4FD0|nr:aldehyde dehydrogenase family protein [Propionimicrobium sp. PCR01-08-3]WIY83581.1 aldehyde dehydrogenase family protein [Propionimicrobium sp. PCR01-08-3]
MNATHQLDKLEPGMIIPLGGDRCAQVDAGLAAAFQPGDSLYFVQDTGALLHVPSGVHHAVTEQVDAAFSAFGRLRTTGRDKISSFYRLFARNLAIAWPKIAEANKQDEERAKAAGRSTTRLVINEKVRNEMIAGLEGWADLVDREPAAGDLAELGVVDHGDWKVRTVAAPLGVIGFVFEGRPNVFADAAGVLATGNTAVLRIGSDALSTAQSICDTSLNPALREAGLPEGTISLVGVRERSAGWALFSDKRLALAVVRGSGRAVTELSSVARQSGIPVSAHGTGGAWMVADTGADASRFAAAVRHSLDRKVCNTLNVVVIAADRADDLVPALLEAADDAAAARGGRARLHIASGSEKWLPDDAFSTAIGVQRAEGTVTEKRATGIRLDQLGAEWEWEATPEISIAVVDDLDRAAELFNEFSPHFVASLISEDPSAHERFRALVDAPFVGDGFTRWVDGQYALNQPELGLSNWERGRLLGRGGVLTGADLTSRRLFAHHDDPEQHR